MPQHHGPCQIWRKPHLTVSEANVISVRAKRDFRIRSIKFAPQPPDLRCLCLASGQKLLTDVYRYISITLVKDLLRTIKPAVFVGSSRKDLQGFPAAVRSGIGQSLFEAQIGEHPHGAKPLKGLSGVLEIRDNFDGDTYRAVYTVRLEGVLYVLHAFQKKSTSGRATPQRHIDLIRQRLRDAEAIHKATRGVR